MINEGNTLKDAAIKAGIDPKTAREYLAIDNPKQPPNHIWRTRKDDFADVWSEVTELLSAQPRLEAKTIFAFLIKKYPGKFQEGQLRTYKEKSKSGKDSAVHLKRYISHRFINQGFFPLLTFHIWMNSILQYRGDHLLTWSTILFSHILIGKA